jgi:hypothetical protein
MEAKELGFDTTLGMDELSLPRIRLVQAMSAEAVEGTAKPGEWVMPDGTRRSEISGVVLGVRRLRYYRRDGELLCSSIGGQVGVGEPGGDCTVCPLSKWTDDGTNRIPPACTLMYEYLLSGDYGVATVRINTRSAGATAHQLNTQLHLFGAGCVEVTIGSQLIQKPQRRYYIPRIVAIRPTTKRPAGELAEPFEEE